jgi:hypothetical protein
MADKARVAGKVDHPVVVGAAGQLIRVFLGRALDEDALHLPTMPR